MDACIYYFTNLSKGWRLIIVNFLFWLFKIAQFLCVCSGCIVCIVSLYSTCCFATCAYNIGSFLRPFISRSPSCPLPLSLPHTTLDQSSLPVDSFHTSYGLMQSNRVLELTDLIKLSGKCVFVIAVVAVLFRAECVIKHRKSYNNWLLLYFIADRKWL